MAEQSKRPPYTSATDLDRLFERMRTLARPPQIDRKWIESFNLAASQPEAVLSALRWLGVVEKDGTVHEEWNELRLPDSRRPTLARLIEQSYADVFGQIDVTEASREDLEGAFIRAYSSGSPAKPIKCFLALCEHAGIQTKAAQRQTPTRTKPLQTSLTPKNTARSQSPARQQKVMEQKQEKEIKLTGDSPVAVALTLNVEIPADWSEDQVRERIAAIRQAIES